MTSKELLTFYNGELHSFLKHKYIIINVISKAHKVVFL